MNPYILYLTIETNNENLFELAEILTGLSGGDGDCSIISTNYKELAEGYDKWRMEPSKYGKKRLGAWFERDDFENANAIVFSDRSNESISFAKNMIGVGENIIYYGN